VIFQFQLEGIAANVAFYPLSVYAICGAAVLVCLGSFAASYFARRGGK